uniref:Prolyl 3,4-dihydroxylase TPA1/OFD1 N-terminal domain-containing protein n=1 Tax=Amphimedon queenslandica TaxID=400682 RepID=A0A1X7URD1_AMPQE
VLLCHDDELEGRRIAYIYYLVDPSWEKKDGVLTASKTCLTISGWFHGPSLPRTSPYK